MAWRLVVFVIRSVPPKLAGLLQYVLISNTPWLPLDLTNYPITFQLKDAPSSDILCVYDHKIKSLEVRIIFHYLLPLESTRMKQSLVNDKHYLTLYHACTFYSDYYCRPKKIICKICWKLKRWLLTKLTV